MTLVMGVCQLYGFSKWRMEMAWQRLIYPLDVNSRTIKIIGDKL